LVGACRGVDLKLEEKTEAWKKIIELELPLGTEKSKILDWGKENNSEFISYNDKTTLVAVLETIEDPGIACSHWTIMMSVEFNGENKSLKNTVTKSGTCL
jgi:hypothetical protein